MLPRRLRAVRSLAVAIALGSALGACGTAGDAAKGAVDSAVDSAVGALQCKAVTGVAESLPPGDTFDATTIAKLGDGAKALQKALNGIPAEQLPGGVKAKVDQALTQAGEAATQYKANPELAKETAGVALDTLRTALQNLQGSLGC